MKLKEVRIKNFRCYREEFSLSFDSLTCIIAKNDAGKSTVLEALDAFFNLEKLETEDRSKGARIAEAIEITCIFSHIQQTIVVDSDAQVTPQEEYLLNSEGQLEITKRFSGASPKCEEVFAKALHPTASSFNNLFDLTIADLRKKATELKVDLTNINQTAKSAIRHAIWSSVGQHELNLQEVPIGIKSTIWKPLHNALPLYQLFRADRPSSDQDAEAQDPIKFAIREALASLEDKLDKIGEHVRKQVEEVTRSTIEKLREMEPALAGELNPTFSPFNWSKVFSVSLTGEGQIPLNKRGSGVRRLFLINFFRAKAEQLANGRNAPDVILAIEEPETSQHPNSQLLILDALIDLSHTPSNQVILTTHNPLLARKINRENIRFIERNSNNTRTVALNDESASGRLRDTLGILPNHNVRVFVGIEGPNDIEFLKRISFTLSQTEKDIPNLDHHESIGSVVFIPMGGSTLEIWTNRLQGLDIPEIHIMDRDVPPPAPAKYENAANQINARDSCTAFTTDCREMENLIHPEAISETFKVTITTIDPYEDVPTLVAKLVHQASTSPKIWSELDPVKRSKKESQAKKRLNREAISKMTAEKLSDSDPNNQVRNWLRAIGQYLDDA